MRIYITLLILTWSFLSCSQTSNFKHDVGLRLSSYQPETFQIQYRYHANKKWAFSATGYYGTRNSYYSQGDYLIQDSIYVLFSTTYQRLNYGVEFGGIRKLSFMKHNYYYIGGSAGVAATVYSRHDERTV